MGTVDKHAHETSVLTGQPAMTCDACTTQSRCRTKWLNPI